MPPILHDGTDVIRSGIEVVQSPRGMSSSAATQSAGSGAFLRATRHDDVAERKGQSFADRLQKRLLAGPTAIKSRLLPVARSPQFGRLPCVVKSLGQSLQIAARRHIFQIDAQLKRPTSHGQQCQCVRIGEVELQRLPLQLQVDERLSEVCILQRQLRGRHAEIFPQQVPEPGSTDHKPQPVPLRDEAMGPFTFVAVQHRLIIGQSVVGRLQGDSPHMQRVPSQRRESRGNGPACCPWRGKGHRQIQDPANGVVDIAMWRLRSGDVTARHPERRPPELAVLALLAALRPTCSREPHWY